MKKLYTTQNVRDLSFSRSHHRSSLFKVASLGTAVALFLSNATPVCSANLDLTKAPLENVKNAAVIYPQSIISAYDYYDGDKENYLTALNVAMMPKVDAFDDYANFLTKTLSGISNDDPIVNVLRADGKNSLERTLDTGGQYKKLIISAQNGENTATIDALNPLRNDVMARMQRGTGMQRDAEVTNVIFGNDIQKDSKIHVGSDVVALGAKIKVNAPDSVAVGYGAQVDNKYTVAVGHLAYAVGKKSIAIGGEGRWADDPIPPEGRTIAKGEESIAIGHRAKADSVKSVAFGTYSKVDVDSGVAIGSDSVADVAAGAIGYDPYIKGPSQSDNFAWKSTQGAVSVGDAKSEKTRQIVGVAAGTELHDAVNVAQLKTLQSYVDQGWTLSVGGENAKAIGIKSTVDLSAVSDNLKITKGAEDNNVKFDLADNITVASVTAGNASMSSDGFLFTGGAKITVDGIDAGKKQITGVVAGEEPDDAVNFAQLQEIKNQIVGNSFVKQDGGEEGTITIGMATGGSEINVANKSGEDRTISGVRAAVNNNDAVNKEQLDGQIADVVDTIKSNSLVKREKETNRITIGKEIEGTEINIVNKSGDARTISGVKEAVKDDEAVNKKQLDGEIADITDSIKVIKEANNFAVLYDKNADGTINYNSVTLGGDKTRAPVALHNVQAGTIAEGSNDAINGSQINKISRDVAGIFGGDAKFHDGILFGPHYHLSHISEDGAAVTKDHNNVGDALTGLDDNINNVNSRLTHVANEFTQKIEGVSKDSLLWSNDEQAFVAQHGEEKTNSKIKFLANGDISANSTDAVNGSQLFETNQTVVNLVTAFNAANKNISSYLGGGADVAANKAPTYKIQDTEHNDVGSAFSSVNNSITDIQNQITNATKNSLVKQEENEGAITIGKATGGTKINVANKLGEDRIISGVKAAVANNEAVNKEQLDKSIEKVSKDINLTTAAAVLYDKNTNGTVNYNSVSLGGNKSQGPVALLNVKDGKIAENSHDAINGSQIEKISQDIANYFGGDAEFVDGAFVGLQYNLSTVSANGEVVQETFENVGDALSGLDANVKHVNDHLTNVVNNFTQQINDISKEVKGDALLWNGDEQAFVAQHGEGRTKSKIKFLANGDISANSTDAVNGSQLYLMSNQLAAYFGGGAGYNNGKWTAPTFKIAQFNNDGSSGEKKTYRDVANAFDGVSESMSKINNRIQNVENNVSSNGLNWNEQKKAYDASHDGQPSKIINVADGKIAEGSKDAVNGGQLWQTNERVTGVEKDVKHLTNRVDNISTTVTDMGETVFHIENRVDNIENTVNNLSDGAVNYDKDADGKKTNKITLKGGNESEPVIIDNVAAGRIEQGSKEAVNGGQLHDYTQEQMKIILDETKHYTDQRVNIVINAIDDAVDRANQYTDMKFNVLSYDIKDIRKEARQAAAIGLAVSNLRYFDDPGSLSVSFGSGAWRGQSAFALGAGYTSENGKIRSNLSATSAGGHWGVGGAITLKIK
ncbi:Vomp family autotransporter [Bartonella taylorii]|uniref:Vomp family autotransporter n=1 Tax=Bartonella taylorii TaxID=33046 RepID=UPI002485AA22|nr:Vomp family autotransporter [Bartonella taylorii]